MIDPDSSLKYLLASEGAVDLPSLAPRHGFKPERMIFVVGCPRSGTTVLGQCLAAHPALAGGEESLFLLDMWRIIADLHQAKNQRGWGPLSQYIDLYTLVQAVARFADTVFRGILINKPSAIGYVDHTPWYASLIPLLLALYPNCYIIHVVRDGRSVAQSLGASWQAGFIWAGADISQRSALWSKMVLEARTGKSMMKDPAHYREVHYEDICRQPADVLSRLLTALSLPWHDEITAPLAVPHASPSRSDVVLAVRDKAGGQVTLTPKEVSTGWPTAWSQEDRLAFATFAGDTLPILGYSD